MKSGGANQIKVALCRCRVNRSSARHCSPARKRTQARHCQVRAGPSSPSRHSTSLGTQPLVQRFVRGELAKKTGCSKLDLFSKLGVFFFTF